MRILIGCPVPPDAIAGPATVARELRSAYTENGDSVRIITFNAFERVIPVPLRHGVFAIRAYFSCAWAERILLLDPASTGPVLAWWAARLKRRCALRIGGDFLWESYVERTGEPLLLSEFYNQPRTLSSREKLIQQATNFTLSHVSDIIFTTAWQRTIWQKPYRIEIQKTHIIDNAIPGRSPEQQPPSNKIFLCAGRSNRVKNAEVIPALWNIVSTKTPDAILDTKTRSPKEYRIALANCYTLILPSLSEVSPNAVYEAISLGKPFITTKDTGVYEAFRELGEFVDTRNPEEIAEAVLRLLDTDIYQKYSARIHAFGHERTWADVASDFRKVFVA